MAGKERKYSGSRTIEYRSYFILVSALRQKNKLTTSFIRVPQFLLIKTFRDTKKERDTRSENFETVNQL